MFGNTNEEEENDEQKKIKNNFEKTKEWLMEMDKWFAEIGIFLESHNRIMKKIWWFLTTSLLFFYVIRREVYKNSGWTTVNILVITTLIILIFLPLVSEINIHGISLKKDIKNLGEKVDEKTLEIKNLISNNIVIKNEINNMKSESVNKTVSSFLEKKTPSLYNKEIAEKDLERINDTLLFLFKVNHLIVFKIRRIVSSYVGNDHIVLTLDTGTVLKFAVTKKIVSEEIENLIIRVLEICDEAIKNGETYNSEYRLVERIFPEINNALNEANIY